MTSCCLLTLTLILTTCITWGSALPAVQDVRLFEEVLTGLEHATEFFSQDYSSINVDGLFGIRLAQGTIIQSLQWCSGGSSSRCPPKLRGRLEDLNATIGMMADRALPYIEADDPAYYSNFLPTIDAPYIISPSYASLGDAIAPPGTQFKYIEAEGDQCLSSVMGQWRKEKGSTPEPICTASEDCLALMTKPGQMAYSITHQVLYFIMVEKTGCLEQVDAKVKAHGFESVKDVEQTMCGHIYSEMVGEVKDGRVDELRQDMFLEQNLLCGVLGFSEFFQPAWVSMVLRWQAAGGCFAMVPRLVHIEQAIIKAGEESKKAKHAQEQLLSLMEDEARRIDHAPMRRGRKLLREKIMENDCLAHKSGLGIGLLGVYQRHLLKASRGHL